MTDANMIDVPTDNQIAFLRTLERTGNFMTAICAVDDGMRVAWSCLINSWIDRGKITEYGHRALTRAWEAKKS